MDLVTIIIPIYNVEKYVGRCIESVLNQTYTNLEILLIDDGSTDASGSICDEYAKKDKRIRVVHKANGGLSDARNAGLAAANGLYLNFLDGDDFVANDMIESLYDSVSLHDADISSVGCVDYYKEGADIGSYSSAQNEQTVLPTEQALSRLLYENNITASACMKLYRRELFGNDIVFPVGRVCEDLGTIYKVFANAKKVVINTAPKYFYYQRSGSIIQSKFSRSRMDGLFFAKEQLTFIQRNFPQLIKAAENRLFVEAIYIMMRIPLRGDKFKSDRAAVFGIINKYKLGVLLDSNARFDIRQRSFVAMLGARTVVYFFRARSFVWRKVKRVAQ